LEFLVFEVSWGGVQLLRVILLQSQAASLAKLEVPALTVLSQ